MTEKRNNPNIVNLKIGKSIIALNFYPSILKLQETEFINNLKQAYKEFISLNPKDEVDFTINFVSTDQIEISSPRKKDFFFFTFRNSGKREITTNYSISIWQFQLILKNLMLKLSAEKNMILFHASAILINNKVFAFTGDSGAGKSTTIKLLSKKFEAYADDTLLISKDNNKFIAYQTPFREKEWWIKRKNKKKELGGIFFLNKSNMFSIKRLKNISKISKMLIKQIMTIESAKRKHMILGLDLTSNFNNYFILNFDKKEKELEKLFNDFSENPKEY